MFGFDSRQGRQPPHDRSPERVERISELLQTLWSRHPELRLGQLLVNVDSRFDTNIYHLEDDEFEAGLRKILDKGGFGK